MTDDGTHIVTNGNAVTSVTSVAIDVVSHNGGTDALRGVRSATNAGKGVVNLKIAAIAVYYGEYGKAGEQVIIAASDFAQASKTIIGKTADLVTKIPGGKFIIYSLEQTIRRLNTLFYRKMGVVLSVFFEGAESFFNRHDIWRIGWQEQQSRSSLSYQFCAAL